MRMDRVATARRAAGMAAAGLMLAASTSCGGSTSETSTRWVSATGPTASAAATAPARLAAVSSACKLLPAKTLSGLLGGSSSTRLTAREEPVEKLADGEQRYTCAYGRDGTEPFALVVSTLPDHGDTAKDAVEGIALASGVKTTRFTVGKVGGVGYAKDGLRFVGLALAYEKELRVVVFTAPELVPHAKLVEVAEHVVTQV